MLVAVIALVIALAGSAVALPGRNSVKRNDIARGAVTSKAIKKNAVKSKHLKNDGVKGRDVDEASLATVPSAAIAGDAAAIAGVRIVRVRPFTLTGGQTQVVLIEGPFTFTASCTIDDLNLDSARILIDTSADDTAYDSGEESNADFDAADPPGRFALDSDPTDTPFIDEESSGTAIAPDGTEIVGSRLYVAANVLGQDDTCRFGGYFGIG